MLVILAESLNAICLFLEFNNLDPSEAFKSTVTILIFTLIIACDQSSKDSTTIVLVEEDSLNHEKEVDSFKEKTIECFKQPNKEFIKMAKQGSFWDSNPEHPDVLYNYLLWHYDSTSSKKFRGGYAGAQNFWQQFSGGMRYSITSMEGSEITQISTSCTHREPLITFVNYIWGIRGDYYGWTYDETSSTYSPEDGGTDGDYSVVIELDKTNHYIIKHISHH